MKRRSGFSAPGTLRPGYLSKTFPVGAWAHHDTQARTGGRRGTPPHPTGGSTPHNPRLAIRGVPDKNIFHGRGRRNTHTAPGRGTSTRRADSRTQLGSGLPTTPLARAGARIPKPRRPPGARRAHHGAEGAGGRRHGALPRDGETHASQGPRPEGSGGCQRPLISPPAARKFSLPVRQISVPAQQFCVRARQISAPARQIRSRHSGSVQECRAASFFGTPATQAPSCGRRSKQPPRRPQYPTPAIRATKQRHRAAPAGRIPNKQGRRLGRRDLPPQLNFLGRVAG